MSGGAGTPEVADGGRRGFLALAVTARGAIAIWFAYVAANAVIRYSLSHTLANDDVNESLLVQTFRLGYSTRNPPLWEWLLWTLQQLVGPGYESHWLLRYGCLVLLGVAAYRAAYAASGSERWSAVVVLSLPLFYQVGWPLLEWGTHSLVLIIVMLFSLELVVRYAAHPSPRLALLLGLSIGLGMMAKFGYALLLASGLFAVLVRRETRTAVLGRESLLVLVAAAVVLAPFSYWLLSQGDLTGEAHRTLAAGGEPYLDRVLFGLSKLVENSAEFLMPWAVVAGGAVWAARLAGLRCESQTGVGEGLAGSILAWSVLISIGTVFAVGPTGFPSGYILPVLIAAIPYSACLLSRHIPDASRARGFAAFSISILVVIALVRLIYLSNSGLPESSYRREMWPIGDLAQQMREAGIDQGTLVAVSGREAGNLRLEIPEMRYVTARQDDQNRPPKLAQNDACWFLWNESEVVAPGERWARTGDGKVVAELPQVAEGEKRSFDVPWASSYFGNQRTSRWSVVELDPNDPLCR